MNNEEKQELIDEFLQHIESDKILAAINLISDRYQKTKYRREFSALLESMINGSLPIPEYEKAITELCDRFNETFMRIIRVL